MVSQGCQDKAQDEKQSDTQTSQANSMIASNEYVLTSTDNEQYIVKKENGGFVLEGAKGKVVIFDIFATWCPPCQAGASHLTSLQNKYKDDLVIIALTIEENIANTKLEDFKKSFGAEYTIVNSAQNRPLVNAIATALELGNRFPIPLMAMYIDGKPVNHYVGEVQEEFIESDIKKALGK